GSNYAYGLDTAMSLYKNVDFTGFYARTQTPGRPGDAGSYRAHLVYGPDLYGFDAEHLVVERNFNPEIGYAQRQDFRRSTLLARFSPRTRKSRTIRKLIWQAGLDYITDARMTRLEDRQG